MDGGAACISCGKWFYYDELDGGHFIPTTSSAIRFDETNINAQCRKCNRFLHGNPRHYLRGMLAKYGEDVVAGLEAREHDMKKWTRDELQQIRIYYRDGINAIKRGEPPEPYNTPLVSMSELFKDLRDT